MRHLRNSRRVLILAAAGCAAVSYIIVFVARIGPVIDVDRGRGVHLGDLLGLLSAAFAVAALAGARTAGTQPFSGDDNCSAEQEQAELRTAGPSAAQ